MNSRYVLYVAGVLLLLVGFVTEENGPLDRFAPPGEDQPDQVASAPAPAGAPSPQSSADFFAGYEPPADEELAFLEADTPVPVTRYQTATTGPAPSPGALSKEQLNVEEPAELASLRPSHE